jgi:ribonuclease Z
VLFRSFLPHFHSDHIGDLGEFNMNTWAMGRPGPLRVYGPPGVERVVAGFAEAYALDTQYRIAHHGTEFLPKAAAPQWCSTKTGSALPRSP